ncbi:MAG TPA: outer membrane lipoprotein LolB [Ramlibacter sp.]|nr:outer membrane lipoprotein LolB [Ramlibacter sp.]
MACVALFALLAGCATPRMTPVEPGIAQWNGRLALQVESDPRQSLSAGFELRGSPDKGELTLFTPIGGTAAVLSWAPGRATLQPNGEPPQEFASLDALVTRATGTAIPVAALFDWLAGVPTAVQGWQADLSQRANGRLRAQRLTPAPAADLRLVLEQP